ncbi:MAG: hypothetical protein Q8K65_11935 [Alphaproteobacteria bacterium]|nr:hypothetical protein [Alphaproteobacteria bacterium]
MPFNKTQLRGLCTAAEFSLAQKSLAPDLGKLSAADLVKNIKRARALRDKGRDLYKRQTRAAGKGADLNARTAEKAQAFDQILKAFEDQLAQLKKASPVSSKKTATKKTAKTAVKKPTPQARVAAKASRKKARAEKVKAKKAPALTSKKALAASEKKSPAATVRWGGFASKAAQDAGKRSQLQQSRSKPILGHVKSAGKRAQAKRDGR